jgi:hypothetical protein
MSAAIYPVMQHSRRMESSKVNLLGDDMRQHLWQLIFTLPIILIPSIKTTTFLKWLPFETSGGKTIKKFLGSLALIHTYCAPHSY